MGGLNATETHEILIFHPEWVVLSIASSSENVRLFVVERSGGETGIRTLDPLARITVFETAPIGRSGISPGPKENKKYDLMLLESQ
jgi:hypothetical protein